MTEQPVLSVNRLRVQLTTANGILQPVDDMAFSIKRGEIYALVGESGCGKTMTALAINRLLPDNAYVCEGSEILLNGQPLQALSEKQMREIRGRKIGMIFQDPALALNPVFTIGEQISETLKHIQNVKSKTALQDRIIELLEKVRIPDPKSMLKKYPHQLSGGMKQRIVIAMALAKSPDLLIADEPTTALDVTTQAQVLSLLKELNQSLGMAVLIITHDLGIVAQMAHNVGVMYAGHLVEESPKQDFIREPSHPYSRQLFAALPDLAKPGQSLSAIPGKVPLLNKAFPLCRFKGRCQYVFKICEEEKPALVQSNEHHLVRCHWYDPTSLKKIPTKIRLQSLLASSERAFRSLVEEGEEFELEPILTVEDLKAYFPIQKGLFKRTVGQIKAVDGVNFTVNEGQTLALVGETGCGKTTVGKAILRLLQASGRVQFQKSDLLKLSKRKLRKKRGEIQMIFQDPYSSMDPHMRVNDIIEEGMLALKVGTNAKERVDRISVLLEQVGLSDHIKGHYIHELSGGQRQRVAIARALAVGAQLIVCDEPTSALDVSVQAQILNLLKSLQEDLVISYLFITHNIGVVRYLAHYVAVMYLGRIVEYGPVEQVLNAPKHPYTQALLKAVPSVQQTPQKLEVLKGEIPNPSSPPAGCHFAPRCPKVHARCLRQYPETYQVGNEHQVRCYLYSPEEIKVTLEEIRDHHPPTHPVSFLGAHDGV